MWTTKLEAILGLILVVMVLSLETVDSSPNEQVRKIPASEILRKIERMEPVVYDNVIINGSLDLTKLKLPTGHVNRTQLEVSRGWLEEAKAVTSLIRINNSRIEGNLKLNNTIFRELIAFMHTTISGDVDFSGSTFSNAANFVVSTFSGSAHFEGSAFKRDAYIVGSRFNEGAFFSGSTFGSDAYFVNSSFSGDASFSGSKFSNNADFSQSRFVKRAFFNESTFGGDACFVDSIFCGNTAFNGTRFGEDADFTNSAFYKKLKLDEIKFSSLIIHWASIKNALIFNGPAYLALIKNFKDMEQFEDAANCYDQYRWKSMLSQNNFLIFAADIVAWQSCGYGIHWRNTIFSFLLLMVLCGAYICIKGDDRGNKLSMRESILFSAIILIGAPKEWYPPGEDEYIGLIKRHIILAYIERLFGIGILILLIGVINRILIRY